MHCEFVGLATAQLTPGAVGQLSVDWSLEDLASAVRPRTSKRAIHNPNRYELTIVGADARDDDVLIRFWWKKYPYLLAMGVGPESDYDDTVESPAHWAADAVTFVSVEMDTGRSATSRRIGGDVLELGSRDWPDDDRFYIQTNWASDPDEEWWATDWTDVRADPTLPRSWRDDGSLISWEWSSVNNSCGTPLVGQSATRWVDDGVASLAFVDVEDAIPDSVRLDLALVSVHGAAAVGARTIVTDLDEPLLDILGFEYIGSRRVLDTRFLDVDIEAAQQVYGEGQGWREPTFVREAVRKARGFRFFTA